MKQQLAEADTRKIIQPRGVLPEVAGYEHAVSHILRTDEARGVLEVLWRAQVPVGFATQRLKAPLIEGLL
jgi:hypothetical protein